MKKVRRFNGEDDSYVEGTATSLRDDTEDQLRQNQLRGESANAPAAEPAAEPAPENTRVQPNFDRFSPPAAKPPVVTKEQLQAFKAKYGADKDLTDYMNAQKGLTRRGGATAMPSNANAAPATPMSTDPSQRTKLKYQSLQDRVEEYAMKNKAAGMGMYGTKKSEPATGTPKRSKNLTDMLGLSSNYASGGKVRSVSSRADGIAQRGKTRGKIC